MSYLTIKERQQYMKELGFYEGKVDGLEGIKTLKAYANLQVRYFARPDDVDGKYGKNTDNLLRSAYVCKDLKYFELPEFKCKCGGKYCTGYPATLFCFASICADDELLLDIYMNGVPHLVLCAVFLTIRISCVLLAHPNFFYMLAF